MKVVSLHSDLSGADTACDIRVMRWRALLAFYIYRDIESARIPQEAVKRERAAGEKNLTRHLKKNRM